MVLMTRTLRSSTTSTSVTPLWRAATGSPRGSAGGNEEGGALSGIRGAWRTWCACAAVLAVVVWLGAPPATTGAQAAPEAGADGERALATLLAVEDFPQLGEQIGGLILNPGLRDGLHPKRSPKSCEAANAAVSKAVGDHQPWGIGIAAGDARLWWGFQQTLIELQPGRTISPVTRQLVKRCRADRIRGLLAEGSDGPVDVVVAGERTYRGATIFHIRASYVAMGMPTRQYYDVVLVERKLWYSTLTIVASPAGTTDVVIEHVIDAVIRKIS